MSEPTCAQRDAASLIFNLPGYTVIDAVDLPLGGRRVTIRADGQDEGCLDCGVISTRVHAWASQRVKDIPAGGELLEVVVKKLRWVCAEQACGRKTFVQVTEQLPFRARCLTRLRAAVLEAVIASGRAVDEVAGAFALAWWTVQAVINAAVMTLPEVDQLRVRLLGIDEHRFRTVRFFRDPDANDGHGAWKRVEPWMTTFVNLATGQVIGVVDGRDSAAVATWLAARTQAWRDRVEVVAIDPSAAFRATVTRQLPRARVSVDHFHLIQLANLMVTQVRQRVAREQLGRCGTTADKAWAHRLLLLRAGDRLSERALDRLFMVTQVRQRVAREQLGRCGTTADKAWAHRLLLLRAGDRLSERALNRLFTVFAHDDPTDELGAAWGVKERLRMLLATTDLDAADRARGLLGVADLAADIPETWKLWNTINVWWEEIETFIETRVTNARTEAANTSIKQIKRTGRGYRNHDHYRAPYSAPQRPPNTAAFTLESAGHHVQLRIARKLRSNVRKKLGHARS